MLEPEVTRLCVKALGVEIPLEVAGERLSAAVTDAWKDARTSAPGEGDPIRIALGPPGAADVTGMSVAEVLHHLSPAVTLRAIEARSGQLVMLHAAAVADLESGATAVLVAPSGTGKTTAATVLGRSFAYLSDETAGITAEGRLLPYRKPLSIIKDSHIKHQASPNSLGLLTTERTCHLSALLVITRDHDHVGEPVVERLETVDALAALAPEASFLARLDLPLQRLVTAVRQADGVRRVTYREAATLEPVVRTLIHRVHR